MADEEEVAIAEDDDESQDDSGAQSGGRNLGLGGIVKVLVILVGFLVFVILSVVISYIVNRVINQSNPGIVISTPEPPPTRTPPYVYYEGIPELRTRTNDPTPQSLTIDIRFGFDAAYVTLSEELSQRNPKLTDMLRSYFSGKSADEIINGEESIKAELKAMINAILINGRIEEVVFMRLEVLNL